MCSPLLLRGGVKDFIYVATAETCDLRGPRLRAKYLRRGHQIVRSVVVLLLTQLS